MPARPRGSRRRRHPSSRQCPGARPESGVGAAPGRAVGDESGITGAVSFPSVRTESVSPGCTSRAGSAGRCPPSRRKERSSVGWSSPDDPRSSSRRSARRRPGGRRRVAPRRRRTRAAGPREATGGCGNGDGRRMRSYSAVLDGSASAGRPGGREDIGARRAAARATERLEHLRDDQVHIAAAEGDDVVARRGRPTRCSRRPPASRARSARATGRRRHRSPARRSLPARGLRARRTRRA